MMFEQPFVIDGGLSTALEQLGNTLDTALWTGALLNDHQDQIRNAHQLYVDAGAEVLISSSYQLSYIGGLERGWSETQVEDAFNSSTELARFANVQVAASIGPYGAYLADGSEYRGNYGLSEDDLKEFHRRRLKTLINTRPDLLAIETIPELTEARALLSLLAELNIDIPAWVSFSCTSETQISSGESFADAVQLVNRSPHVAAIGINCTAPALVEPLLRYASSSKPFIVYPNSGREWDAESKRWLGPEAGFEPSLVKRWKAAGAVGIGGCCGVGPGAITLLKEQVWG